MSKTSEIQRRRLPNDPSVNKDHQKSTEKSPSQVLPTSKNPLRGSPPSHTLTSRPRSLLKVDQASPTDKPEDHRNQSTEKSTSKDQLVYQDSTETVYRKRIQKSTVKSTKSIKSLLKPPFESSTMKLAGWSPKRTSNNESIWRTDDYPLQEILYRACGSTARMLKRVQVHLNFVSITIDREAHLLDVD